jgi:hypothetical protein
MDFSLYGFFLAYFGSCKMYTKNLPKPGRFTLNIRCGCADILLFLEANTS